MLEYCPSILVVLSSLTLSSRSRLTPFLFILSVSLFTFARDRCGTCFSVQVIPFFALSTLFFCSWQIIDGENRYESGIIGDYLSFGRNDASINL